MLFCSDFFDVMSVEIIVEFDVLKLNKLLILEWL